MDRLFRRRDARGAPAGPYYAQWFDHAGVRHQRSTRSHDRRTAEQLQRQWEAAAADPARARADAATLSDAVRCLLAHRRGEAAVGKRSAATVGFYAQKSAQLIRVFEYDGDPTNPYRPLPLPRLDAAAVDRYVARRRAEYADPGKAAVTAVGRRKARAARAPRPVSEHTIAKELVTLRAALRAAGRAGLWRGDLAAVLPIGFSAGYVPRTRWLPAAELARLLAVLGPDRAARVAFAVATSARWAETDAAQARDCAADGALVRLRGTKTAAASRVVPVVTAGARALVRYAVDHGAGCEGLLFTPWTNRGRDLKAACRRAGIDPCTPNDLRRSFAQWLRHGGASPELIAPAMGHASPQMVRAVYGRLDPEALGAQLAAAIGTPWMDCSSCSTAGADSVDSAGQSGRDCDENAGEKAGNLVGCVGHDPTTRGLKVPDSRPRFSGEARENTSQTVWPAPKNSRTAADVQRPAADAPSPRRRK